MILSPTKRIIGLTFFFTIAGKTNSLVKFSAEKFLLPGSLNIHKPAIFGQKKINMNRISTFFILFTLALFPAIIFAQENFQPAYIITATDDTVKGMIDFKDWPHNPAKIRFKKTEHGPERIYSPADLKAFHVSGELYKGAIVDIETSPRGSAGDLSHDPALTLHQDTVFLESIVEGQKSLLAYQSVRGIKNYYIYIDGRYELLVYKKYIKPTENVIVENRKFSGQLLIYLDDCPKLRTKINTVAYEGKNLQKLFNAYYTCTGKTIALEKQHKKREKIWGLYAGMSSTKFEYLKENPEYLYGAEFDRSNNFTVGVYNDFVFPRLHERLSLQNALHITNFTLNTNYSVIENEENYTNYTVDIGCGQLKLFTAAKYKYPIGKTYIYARFGMTNSIWVFGANQLKAESYFWGTESVKYQNAIENPATWELGWFGGIGVNYKRFSLGIDYESGNGIVSGVKTKDKKYYILLGFEF